MRVDLRSDTVTRPTPAMREAMAGAEVGDDVFGDDPTVQALEIEVARILGKEAALFVPSGTMANAVAVATHTRRGDEVLLEETAHVFQYEGAGSAALAGVQLWPIPGDRGMPTMEQVVSRIRGVDVHYPVSRLLCLENTHNRAGGRVLPQDAVEELATAAHQRGLQVHLDGARLWNAAVASNTPEAELASPFDSVSVCFSKGLGAPVGSALAGTSTFIDEARNVRKRLGGGMRQAGILAAGAIHSLAHHRERLADDHARAQRLAAGIASLTGLSVPSDRTETNIVVADVQSGEPARWLEALAVREVFAVPFGGRGIRFVTHLDVGDDHIDAALGVLAEADREIR